MAFVPRKHGRLLHQHDRVIWKLAPRLWSGAGGAAPELTEALRLPQESRTQHHFFQETT